MISAVSGIDSESALNMISCTHIKSMCPACSVLMHWKSSVSGAEPAPEYESSRAWCVTFIGVERFDWQQAEPQRDRCVDAIERMGQYSMPDNARKPAHDIAKKAQILTLAGPYA